MPEKEQAEAERTAIVTGASSGIGAAIALAFGDLGWRVALGARREGRLQDVAAGVEKGGGRAFCHSLDVANVESIEAFFAASRDAFGIADVIVSNAGISIPGRLREISNQELERELSVNLLGPIWVARRAMIDLLDANQRGDIVFISSDAVPHPRPLQSSYSAAKAGVENFAAALGMELEGTGIRATVVRPGMAASEFGTSWEPKKIVEMVEFWQHFGLQRHPGVMPAAAVARAVVVAVTTPPGVHLGIIEVQPEAPMSS